MKFTKTIISSYFVAQHTAIMEYLDQAGDAILFY